MGKEGFDLSVAAAWGDGRQPSWVGVWRADGGFVDWRGWVGFALAPVEVGGDVSSRENWRDSRAAIPTFNHVTHTMALSAKNQKLFRSSVF